ncbi:hypothetical protein FXO38_09730 [Capsicum annuum]|nr:hypothetical protein FXO38_09730 [Capsicum annuum]
MPHRARPMTGLLLFTGLNVVLVSTITPVYDFVCFHPYWERRREHRRREREAALRSSTSAQVEQVLSWLTRHILLVYLFFSKRIVTLRFFCFSEETIVVPSVFVCVWLSESGIKRTERSWVVSRFFIAMLIMYLEALERSARWFSRLIRALLL